MTDPILQQAIGLNPGADIELYIIDLRTAGYDKVLYFTPSDQNGTTIWFRGMEFQPRPINVSGYKRQSDDAPPEPTLSFNNIDKGGNALLAQYGDLINAEVTRIVTMDIFLDRLPNGANNPTADPSAMNLPEVYYIQQKIGNTPQMVTWALSSVLDLSGKQIPAREVMKDICGRTYRVWDAVNNRWRYPAKRGCPYTGTDMFDRNGDPTADPTQDVCPKNMRLGCAKRFPKQDLPGWFFPGVLRLPR